LVRCRWSPVAVIAEAASASAAAAVVTVDNAVGSLHFNVLLLLLRLNVAAKLQLLLLHFLMLPFSYATVLG
jgi:hypothetical protein